MTTKGSWHRPHNKDKFNQEFDRIFGAKKKRTQTTADVKEKVLKSTN